MPTSEVLSTLLFIYVAILLVNCVLSLALWYHQQREQYHWLTLKLWVGMFIAILLQAVFSEKNILTVFGFCTYFFCSIQLTRLLSLASHIQCPERRYELFMGAALLAAAVASAFHLSLFWMAIFPAMGISFPMFHAAYLAVRKQGLRGAGMSQIFIALLVLNALHFMDYPFLRHSDANAVVGFALALVFVFCFSIFLPSYSIANIGARYSSRLEGEVQRRTESLYAANVELRALSEEHDHLLRLVVHDIANPLTVVTFNMGSLEKIHQNDEPGSLSYKIYNKMQMAIRAITDVLENVKNLHSLRTGKVSLKLTPVSIGEALREQLVMFEPRLQAKQLKIRLEQKAGAAVTVLAEPTSLKNHVLANLISNAIKYSEPGGEIVLTVEDTGGTIQVTITDRGIGMPPSLIPKLFDMNKPTSRPGTGGEKGTGFGMPIVKKYLDRYGAQIRVRSEMKTDPTLKHGTEFQIQFKKAA